MKHNLGLHYFVSILLMIVSCSGTFLLTRSTWVREPVRTFYSNPSLFEMTWRHIQSEGPDSKALEMDKARLGVRYYSVEKGYVFFYIPNLPPDAMEVYGCSLDEKHRPESVIYRFPDRNTFEFNVLDNHWFYWLYDYDTSPDRGVPENTK